MTETTRVTLKELPSGKIELVLASGVLQVLQFNASCADALPYCRGLCCRMRSGINAELTEAEAQQFKSKKSVTGLYVLQSKPEDDSCVYLESDTAFCKIQETKPVICRTWHCSPHGVNSDGTVPSFRDKGWFLSPLGALTRKAI